MTTTNGLMNRDFREQVHSHGNRICGGLVDRALSYACRQVLARLADAPQDDDDFTDIPAVSIALVLMGMVRLCEEPVHLVLRLEEALDEGWDVDTADGIEALAASMSLMDLAAANGILSTEFERYIGTLREVDGKEETDRTMPWLAPMLAAAEQRQIMEVLLAGGDAMGDKLPQMIATQLAAYRNIVDRADARLEEALCVIESLGHKPTWQRAKSLTMRKHAQFNNVLAEYVPGKWFVAYEPCPQEIEDREMMDALRDKYMLGILG